MKASADAAEQAEARPDPALEKRELRIQLRNEAFRLLRHLARGEFTEAATLIVASDPARARGGSDAPPEDDAPKVKLLASELEKKMTEYRVDHSGVLTDSRARGTEHTHVEESLETWTIEQTLTDPDEHNDWSLKLSLDLASTRLLGRLSWEFLSLSAITA